MKSFLQMGFVFLFLLLAGSLLKIQAQLPQGFKYQTVVRNSAGLAISNESIDFILSILAGSPEGAVVYSETQTAQSSPMGVVSLMVGQGTPQTSTFDQIDWSSGNFYLKVEVKVYGAADFSTMGTSQLVSVPYALYAQSSGAGQWSGDSKSIYYNGAVGIRGAVDTTGQGSDTILFEIKAQNGDPIFQVFESGVRINVEQGYGKGAKGGFVVGGRNGAKGQSLDLMRITNDSIRLYMDVSSKKGSKAGFAVGGRNSSKGGTPINFMHITPENTFIGQESGLYNNGGINNIFLGNSSGYTNTTGADNIFIGNTSGYNNIDGYFNVFIGRESGYENTYGYSNIFIGDGSGGSNSEGQSNVYVGDYSGHLNDLGVQNVYLGAYAGSSAYADTNIFIGYYAGYGNQTGNNNVFLGSESGENNVSGRDNVFIGTNTGIWNDSGYDNIFMGTESGNSNTSGFHNVFIGKNAGFSNYDGAYNNLVGTYSGMNITSGQYNNFLGDATGENTTTGDYNLFLGDWAGRDNVDGTENVYLGADAGLNSTGSYNVFIGTSAGSTETGSNKLYIANSSVDNTGALIYGEFDNKMLRFNGNVGIDNDGFSGYGLVIGNVSSSYTDALYIYGNAYSNTGNWYTSSDIRLKNNILNLGSVLDKTLALRPVTYDWKDPAAAKRSGKQIGLIAQEVETLFPELVRADDEGMKSIDYTKLSVILIQSFKEQQQIISKQQNDLEQAQKAISLLNEENTSMKQQLQKLSEMQIELNKIKAVIGMPASK